MGDYAVDDARVESEYGGEIECGWRGFCLEFVG